jgi:hypothetical protein
MVAVAATGKEAARAGEQAGIGHADEVVAALERRFGPHDDLLACPAFR